MNKALFAALDMLESTKGIPKAYMYEKLEAALVNAYRREMGGSTNVRVQINEEKYDFRVFKRLEIVEEVTDSVTQISLEEAKKISKKKDFQKECNRRNYRNRSKTRRIQKTQRHYRQTGYSTGNKRSRERHAP